MHKASEIHPNVFEVYVEQRTETNYRIVKADFDIFSINRWQGAYFDFVANTNSMETALTIVEVLEKQEKEQKTK